MAQVKGEPLLNKLILLFLFDKMEAPMTEETILEICTSANNWISYMDCKPLIGRLRNSELIYDVSTSGKPLYAITADGRICLANYFIKIPISLREEISLFVKNNRGKFRKKQECFADYFMNMDGTYTVHLKIIEPAQPLMELKFVVPSRQIAKNIYRSWEDKAADFYALIYDNLVD